MCNLGGDTGDRTPDPKLAKLVLSHLSYVPNKLLPVTIYTIFITCDLAIIARTQAMPLRDFDPDSLAQDSTTIKMRTYRTRLVCVIRPNQSKRRVALTSFYHRRVFLVPH